MKELFLPFTKREWRIRMLLSGSLFLLIALPFKSLLTLVPGMTEVRPANMVPVVFGLLWGPAGAWGIAIANAVTDIVSGSPVRVWVPGLIINFFYAWLPYKLWYSLHFRQQWVEEPRLKSVRDILKFIYVVFLTSLVTTLLLSLLFEILGFQDFGSSGLLLFFNNFDFAVVLGIPLILLLTSRGKVVFWIPCEKVRKEKAAEYPAGEKGTTNSFPKRLGDLLLYSMCVFGIVYYLSSRYLGARIPERYEVVLLVLFLLFEVLYLFRPYAEYHSSIQTVSIRRMSIRAKVVLGFLLVTVFSVMMTGIVDYNARASVSTSPVELWEHIYITVGVSLNVMFLVSILFLRYVEKNITEPVELLVKQVDEFAGRDHYADIQKKQNWKKDRIQIRTGDEIEGLSESFGRMMDDITSYVSNLATVTAEKERIGAELNVATQIQANMLPRIFPPFPERKEFDIYATMTPAKEVGGDFYDFFLIDDDHLALVMADVSGKGVPAALFMVIAKTLIKNRTQMGGSPAEVLSDVNEQLCEGNEAELFVTVWLAIIEISTGKGIVANAGHEHPALKRQDGRFELVKYRHSPAVAVMEGIRFREHEFELRPGDCLYVYTDGVTEATNEDNELFGEERLIAALNRETGITQEKLLGNVKEEIDLFVADAPQFDDITMMGLVWNGMETIPVTE